MTSMPGLQYGVMAAAVTEDPRQAPRLARAAGFAGLLFDARSAALDIPGLSGSGRREFRHVLAAQEQQLVGLRVDLGAEGLSPKAAVDRALFQIERAMEAAKALGAPLVCVDLGPLPAAPAEERPRPAPAPQQAGLIILPPGVGERPQEQAAEPQRSPADAAFESHLDPVMVELGRRADRYSVTVALRSELAGLAAVERVLKRAGCPWFGWDLDPVAILLDRWSMDEVFSRMGPLIRHVRGRDAVLGQDRRTKPAEIGRGSVQWGELLGDLDSGGYHGWVTIDPIELADRAGAARRGLAYLRR